MSDPIDDFLAELTQGIEHRLRAQLARHLAIDPTTNPHRIIDIQIKQEHEKLTKLAEKYDEQGQTSMADVVEHLAEEWLPHLAKQFKNR